MSASSRVSATESAAIMAQLRVGPFVEVEGSGYSSTEADNFVRDIREAIVRAIERSVR